VRAADRSSLARRSPDEMIFRKIEFEDACGLFAVHIATREKRMTMEPLAEMGITPDSTA